MLFVGKVHPRHESVWKEMKEGVSCQSADGQSHQELDEVLIENLLHDGDDQDAKNAAGADSNNRDCSVQPDFRSRVVSSAKKNIFIC